ncbi:condensation domain-containing protein [Actinokineospora sp. NPDC004072]
MSLPVRTLSVPFAVPGARSGPVALGQHNVLRWLGGDGGDALPAFVPVPPGRSVEDVADAVGVVVARHESLRTVFDGQVQRVLGTGAVPVSVYELDGDEVAFVGGLVVRLLREPFDVAADLPVRALVVTRCGAPFIAVLLLSHAAVDGTAATLLGRQVAALLDGDRSAPPVEHQPIDQALWERSPAGQRRTAASLRYWAARLREAPQALFTVPHPEGVPGHREVRMLSSALAGALVPVVARTGVSPSSVVLAAAVGLLAAHTGADPGALVSISGNRFRSGWRDYIGPLAQDALVPYAVAGSGGFDALARQLGSATLAAYRCAHFDSVDLWEVMDGVAEERGVRFHRDCVFSDLGVAEPEPPVERTRFEPMFDRPLPTAFYLTLGAVSGAVDLRLHTDTRYVPDPARFLAAVERLVVAAAERDVPVAGFAAASGVDQVLPGPGWARVDSCWVDLAQVGALVGGAAFVEDGALVAYATEGTPEELRERCMAGLHPAVMAPHRFVVCGQAPADPGDAAAWRRMPVVASGSGRQTPA